MPTAAPEKTRRQRRSVSAARRSRSAHAASALERFLALRKFFAHDALLAEALHWDLGTVAEWREQRVTRPQRTKMVQVALVYQLCTEARAYLDSDRDAGRWVTAPLPNLTLEGRRGLTPAEWVRVRKATGLRELTYGMVDWMPKVPETDLEFSDSNASPGSVASDTPAVREFERMLAELG